MTSQPGTMSMAETRTSTRVIYHVEDESTPYMVKLHHPPSPPHQVLLRDLKAVLKRPHCKYFFKVNDTDFGVVREELKGDDLQLPFFNGRVVCWIESAGQDDVGSDVTLTNQSPRAQNADLNDGMSPLSTSTYHVPSDIGEREAGVGDTRPPSFCARTRQPSAASCHANGDESDSELNGSTITSVSQIRPKAGSASSSSSSTSSSTDECLDLRREKMTYDDLNFMSPSLDPGDNRHGSATGDRVVAASAAVNVISEIEMARGNAEIEDRADHNAGDDDEEEDAWTLDMSTSHFTSVSRQAPNHLATGSIGIGGTVGPHSRQKPPRHGGIRDIRRFAASPDYSTGDAASSVTSVRHVTVELKMDVVKFLGISIVGQSDRRMRRTAGSASSPASAEAADRGIYVGAIMPGGAVHRDGRIKPGDMIVQVNDVNFQNLSNDDAVRTLRQIVQAPGPIRLVVAKYWPEYEAAATPHAPDSNNNVKGSKRQQQRHSMMLSSARLSARTEPIRPIDPVAWVAHTDAIRELQGHLSPPTSNTYFGSSEAGDASLDVSALPPQWPQRHLNVTAVDDGTDGASGVGAVAAAETATSASSEASRATAPPPASMFSGHRFHHQNLPHHPHHQQHHRQHHRPHINLQHQHNNVCGSATASDFGGNFGHHQHNQHSQPRGEPPPLSRQMDHRAEQTRGSVAANYGSLPAHYAHRHRRHNLQRSHQLDRGVIGVPTATPPSSEDGGSAATASCCAQTGDSTAAVVSSTAREVAEAAWFSSCWAEVGDGEDASLATSRLDVRPRIWLKMKIADSFIGGDLVDWVWCNVSGFADRKSCKKYVASQMLQPKLIRHAIFPNSTKAFSEQTYYTFAPSICNRV